jgi:hypothetical protein
VINNQGKARLDNKLRCMQPTVMSIEIFDEITGGNGWYNMIEEGIDDIK